MCLLKLKSQRFALAVFTMLCAFAGNLGAQEGPFWPVYQRLIVMDDLVEPWEEVGEVAIWNTRDELKIGVRLMATGSRNSVSTSSRIQRKYKPS